MTMDKGERIRYVILTILIPFIGIMMGIVFMTKSDNEARRFGEILLFSGFLACIIYFIVSVLIMIT